MRSLIAALTLCICIPAHAYTRSQAQACYPDARRLCGAPADYRTATLAQRAGIIICMIAHQGELSPRCLKAFGK